MTPRACPDCHQFGQAVKGITPRHTLRASLRHRVQEGQEYYFCTTPSCDTVYYSSGGDRFGQEALLKPVTLKAPEAGETPLCYCFKITVAEIKSAIARGESPNPYASVAEQMKTRGCFCEKSNPSGHCCLSTIAHWMADHGLPLPGD